MPASPSTMFQTLADKGINIQVISTSEIKVSVLIAEEYTELALRALALRPTGSTPRMTRASMAPDGSA